MSDALGALAPSITKPVLTRPSAAASRLFRFIDLRAFLRVVLFTTQPIYSVSCFFSRRVTFTSMYTFKSRTQTFFFGNFCFILISFSPIFVADWLAVKLWSSLLKRDSFNCFTFNQSLFNKEHSFAFLLIDFPRKG